MRKKIFNIIRRRQYSGPTPRAGHPLNVSMPHHHRQADDLGRHLEIAECISHPRRLRGAPHQLKLVSPDNAL
jgi:hypothetical protein